MPITRESMNISSGKTHNNKLRFAAAVMALAVLFFVFLSVFFIAHEADHDCTGDDCPVCALIQMCENNIRQLGNGTSAAAAEAALVFLTFILPVLMTGALAGSTPVSRKTRLNY